MGAETRSQLAAEVAAVREGVKLRGKAVVGHVALREKWEREVTELEERRAQLVEQEKALKGEWALLDHRSPITPITRMRAPTTSPCPDHLTVPARPPHRA
ncbi:unnamed protein product [Closterium sp. NIES-54]